MSEKAMSLNFDLTGNGTARRFAVRVHQNGARTDCGFEAVVSLTELEDKARQLAAIIAGWHQEQDLPVEEHEHPGGIGDGLYEGVGSPS